MIDDDLRYPNRKKTKGEEPPFGFEIKDSTTPFSEPAEAEPKLPSFEKTDFELPRGSSYRVIEPAAVIPQETLMPAELNSLYAACAEAEVKRAASEAYTPHPLSSGRASAPLPSSREVWIERIRIFCESPTRVYATAGVGLGILLALVIAMVFWLSAEPEGRYDLGTATSSAAGLKGQLYIQWEKKLRYRLMLEPSDPDQKDGFELAVANSSRPLSVLIQLQDNLGFVLCTKDVLLKYDSKNSATLADPTAESQPRNADTVGAASTPPAPAQLDAAEAAREHDKDIFQNQIGPDGQIAALNAQGEIPCSAKAYEKTSAWSFVTDFPSLAEQEDMVKLEAKAQADAERPSAQAEAARRKAAARTAGRYFTFALEGDDSIVEFDSARGVIETTGRKTFFFDKNGGNINDARWEDYPVSVHYRCDQNSVCIITRAGLGALRARLRR